MLPPVARSKLAYPVGVLIETVNGVRRPEGSVRLLAGLPVYIDGSAEAPGTAFASASAAVVQFGLDGKEVRAFQIALELNGPCSAVAGEMRAFAILLDIL